MTAHVLAHQVWPELGREHTALIHAGTGNVNLLLIQLLKNLGVRVLVTVSNAHKADVAREVGADFAIVHTDEDVVESVRRLTGGAGADIVFDGIGQVTFRASLESLKPRGCLVMYGETSGPPAPISPSEFGRVGSQFLTRMFLFHYLTSAKERQAAADAVFRLVLSGELTSPYQKAFSFSQARQAQTLFQDRSNIGKIVLLTG